MAELMTIVLFFGAILAAYGFAATHREYFERLFNKLFDSDENF